MVCLKKDIPAMRHRSLFSWLLYCVIGGAVVYFMGILTYHLNDGVKHTEMAEFVSLSSHSFREEDQPATGGFKAVGSASFVMRRTRIHLITSLFKGSYSDDRFQEILTAIHTNVDHPLFSSVHLFTEEGLDPHKYFTSPKVDVIMESEPTYKMFFERANTLPPSDIVVVANADIVFDASLSCVDQHHLAKNNLVYALSRHPSDHCDDGHRRSGVSYNRCRDYRWPSHDAFLFAPKLPQALLDSVNHRQNAPGAEVKVMEEFRKNHYKLRNPCLSIVVRHHHCTNERQRVDRVIEGGKGSSYVFPSLLTHCPFSDNPQTSSSLAAAAQLHREADVLGSVVQLQGGEDEQQQQQQQQDQEGGGEMENELGESPDGDDDAGGGGGDQRQNHLRPPKLTVGLRRYHNRQPSLLPLRKRHLGDRCVVLAPGPSLNVMGNLSFLQDEVTFATNLFPRAEDQFDFDPTYYVVGDAMLGAQHLSMFLDAAAASSQLHQDQHVREALQARAAATAAAAAAGGAGVNPASDRYSNSNSNGQTPLFHGAHHSGGADAAVGPAKFEEAPHIAGIGGWGGGGRGLLQAEVEVEAAAAAAVADADVDVDGYGQGEGQGEGQGQGQGQGEGEGQGQGQGQGTEAVAAAAVATPTTVEVKEEAEAVVSVEGGEGERKFEGEGEGGGVVAAEAAGIAETAGTLTPDVMGTGAAAAGAAAAAGVGAVESHTTSPYPDPDPEGGVGGGVHSYSDPEATSPDPSPSPIPRSSSSSSSSSRRGRERKLSEVLFPRSALDLLGGEGAVLEQYTPPGFTVYNDEFGDFFSEDASESVSTAGSSVAVALQFALYAGCGQVVLLGADHRFVLDGAPGEVVRAGEEDVNHFHPHYFAPGVEYTNPDPQAIEQSLERAFRVYKSRMREIVDATVAGNLAIFRKQYYKLLFDLQ